MNGDYFGNWKSHLCSTTVPGVGCISMVTNGQLCAAPCADWGRSTPRLIGLDSKARGALRTYSAGLLPTTGLWCVCNPSMLDVLWVFVIFDRNESWLWVKWVIISFNFVVGTLYLASWLSWDLKDVISCWEHVMVTKPKNQDGSYSEGHRLYLFISWKEKVYLIKSVVITTCDLARESGKSQPHTLQDVPFS